MMIEFIDSTIPANNNMVAISEHGDRRVEVRYLEPFSEWIGAIPQRAQGPRLYVDICRC